MEGVGALRLRFRPTLRAIGSTPGNPPDRGLLTLRAIGRRASGRAPSTASVGTQLGNHPGRNGAAGADTSLTTVNLARRRLCSASTASASASSKKNPQKKKRPGGLTT